jgi:hypothetical protein
MRVVYFPVPGGHDYLVVHQVLYLASEDGVSPQHLLEMITL